MLESVLKNIRIVLVETNHPGNIGAAARAMKTMGLDDLVLVKPKEFPSQTAIWRAAGAAEVVENARVFETLTSAISDCSLVVAASARQRRIPWPMLEPDECATKALDFAASEKVALVFGREDRGLENEELQMCNYHVAINGNQDYPVLNLAAAVQVFCYELRKNALKRFAVEVDESTRAGERPCYLENWDESFADHADMQRFYKHLEQVLIEIDFHNPENPRQLMTRLQRLFNRAHLDVMEMNILRGVLTAIQKVVKEKQ